MGVDTTGRAGHSAGIGNHRSGLILTTLGGASLAVQGRSGNKSARRGSTLFGPGKPVALLAYLASAPERRAPRERITDLLWSDRPSDIAQHDLRQTLWHIRHRLGSDIIASRSGDLVLNRVVRCDRDAFLAALEGGHVERAIRLYQGNFLSGLGSSGSTGFDEWANLERYRLSRTFCNSAREMVRRAVRAGDFARAVALAKRVRDAHQADESCWRLYIETLLAGGERIRAATEADLLEWQLAMAGREPEPPTRELLRRARRRATPQEGPAVGPVASRFVGREQEMAVLLRAWEAAKRRHGSQLAIVAPTGFGKTSFLKEAKRRLQALGARVVYLVSNWTTRDVPYVLASDVATALAEQPGAAAVSAGTAATLVALNPTLSRRFPVAPDPAIGEEAVRNRLFALLELLQSVAEEHPLVLLLDDVHWADSRSREVLEAVWGRADRFRTIIVTASRTVFTHGESGQATTLRLGGLRADDLRLLLQGMGALPDAPWARELPERLQAVAGGSPLATLDLLERAADTGVLAVENDTWSCTEPAALSTRLEGLSGTRIQPIEPHQRSILVIPFAADDVLVNAFTEGLSEEVIAALTGIDSLRVISWASAKKFKGNAREIAALASEINARYVLQGRLGGSLETVRVTLDLVHIASSTIVWSAQRTLSVAALSELAQQSARDIAAALDVTLTPTEDRRLRRRAIPDGRAYECYLRAREAAGHDTIEGFRRAVSLLRAGLKSGGDDPLLYALLGTVYAKQSMQMLATDGTIRRVEACARKAMELDPESADAHFLQGLASCHRGQVKSGLRALLRALAINPTHTEALYWATGWLGSVGRIETARPLVQRLLETDPLTSTHVAMPGWIEYMGGRFAAAIPWYHRWSASEPRNPVALHLTGAVLMWAGRFAEARSVLESLASVEPPSPLAAFNPFIFAVMAGDRPKALAAVGPELAAAAASLGITCWNMAAWYAMVDAPDEAMEWLERAVSRGFLNYPMLAEYDPFLKRLRGDARYETLLERVKREWESVEL